MNAITEMPPPLVFTEKDADLFVKKLDEILQEDPSQPQR